MPKWLTTRDEPPPNQSTKEARTSREKSSGKFGQRKWKAFTLSKWFLLCTAAVTLGLIGLLEYLVVLSERHDGLIFASNISELPLRQSFRYLYLPTILSVLYSLVWSWIDLDIKRTEPWRQLSKSYDATAADSILLQYPFEFLPCVPITSLRRRHWLVFLSSCAIVLTSWAIVPLQAAIFAVDNISKALGVPIAVSNSRLSLDEQADRVNANYSYSVYSIAWLSGRLPPYMSQQAALAPFQPKDILDLEDRETWTTTTTLYSVDVSCETANVKSEKVGKFTTQYYESSSGCSIPLPYGLDGNDTVGDGIGVYQTKQYSTIYAGYENHGGLADYYISSYCPNNASHTFLAGFVKNKEHAADPPNSPTMLFCSPSYYEQNVTATVRAQDSSVVNYTSIGLKQPLPTTLFNTKRLEWQMNSATQQDYVRGDVPSSKWPDQNQRLLDLDISLLSGAGEIPMMAGMAVGVSQRPLEEYLDPKVLGKSYEAAYQLLFARAMVDVLQPDFDRVHNVQGTKMYETQAVRVIPGFAHAVAGLLILVALFDFALIVLLHRSRLELQCDPGSISALMRLVADDSKLLGQMCNLDRANHKTLSSYLKSTVYALDTTNQSCKLRFRSHPIQTHPGQSTVKGPPGWRRYLSSSPLPIELSTLSGSAFITVQVCLIFIIAYLYEISKGNGIALPSQNRFARQIVENYLPTIIAALMEPIWILLARLIAVIQPLEQLNRCETLAKRSIDLSYSALPPQLVTFKALGAKHYILAAAGGMAFLANVLAVAFSGMFNENVASMASAANITRPYQPLFQDVWNATAKDETLWMLDHFNIAMANLTFGAPLPAWTDDEAFYMPFSMATVAGSEGGAFRAMTRAFGLRLDCSPLGADDLSSWDLAIGPDAEFEDYAQSANLTITLQDDTLGEIKCESLNLEVRTQSQNGRCPKGDSALELVVRTQRTSSASPKLKQVCNETVVAAWLRSLPADRCFKGSDDTVSLTPSFMDEGSMVIACRPRVVSKPVELTVDSKGLVQSVSTDNDWTTEVDEFFLQAPSELVIEANNELITIPYGLTSSGGVWHSDRFPSDWNNYLMQHVNGTDAFLDPDLPLPPADEMIPLFQKMYSKLFAIWLGIQYQKILTPTDPSIADEAEGAVLALETRIFLSTPMFWIAEITLAMYVLATAVIYLQRPGRFLPCLPTSIASNLALFATSRAVEDFKTERIGTFAVEEQVVEVKYGYGTFLGTDRRVHVGIERAPFVTGMRQKRTWDDGLWTRFRKRVKR